jgi:uncharacterized protein (TIGR02266 family)
MAAAETESRHAERARYFAEVDVLRNGTPKPLRLWGENLSEGGIFLQTSQPWSVGERLALRIPVEDERVVIRQAEVAWVRPFEPINVDGRLPGIGVRFLAVDPPYRAAIRQLMVSCAEHQNDDAELADEVPMPPPLADVVAFSPSSPTPSSAFKILAPLSLPPIAEAEYTLKGWVLEKAPRDLQAKVSAPAQVEPSGPASLGSATVEESMRWQLGPPPLRPSRAPVAVDTSVPAHISLLPFVTEHPRSLARDDVKALAEADDAAFGRHSIPPAKADASLLGNVSIHDEDDGRGRFDIPGHEDENEDEEGESDEESTAELRRASTVEDRVPFRLVIERPNDDDQSTFAPRAAPRRSPMNFVMGGLIVAIGAVGGVFLGLDEPTKKTTQGTDATASSPRSVDEAERALHALMDEAQSISTNASVAPPVAPPVAQPVPPPVSPKAAEAPAPTPTVVVADVKAAAADVENRPLPRKPSPTEPTMTNTVVVDRAPNEMVIERGRVTLPLAAGTVKSAFTLMGPPRVVVDLEEAKLAAFQEIPVAEKGISKIRFGRPNPNTVRVVVELDAGATPHDVTTLKRQGSLAIAWR